MSFSEAVGLTGLTSGLYSQPVLDRLRIGMRQYKDTMRLWTKSTSAKNAPFRLEKANDFLRRATTDADNTSQELAIIPLPFFGA